MEAARSSDYPNKISCLTFSENLMIHAWMVSDCACSLSCFCQHMRSTDLLLPCGCQIVCMCTFAVSDCMQHMHLWQALPGSSAMTSRYGTSSRASNHCYMVQQRAALHKHGAFAGRHEWASWRVLENIASIEKCAAIGERPSKSVQNVSAVRARGLLLVGSRGA